MLDRSRTDLERSHAHIDRSLSFQSNNASPSPKEADATSPQPTNNSKKTKMACMAATTMKQIWFIFDHLSYTIRSTFCRRRSEYFSAPLLLLWSLHFNLKVEREIEILQYSIRPRSLSFMCRYVSLIFGHMYISTTFSFSGVRFLKLISCVILWQC